MYLIHYEKPKKPKKPTQNPKNQSNKQTKKKNHHQKNLKHCFLFFNISGNKYFFSAILVSLVVNNLYKIQDRKDCVFMR